LTLRAPAEGLRAGVPLLDEAENIDKQYDIRGRRRSYDTLARMAPRAHNLPVLFVTDRLQFQVEQHYTQGVADGCGAGVPMRANGSSGTFEESSLCGRPY
jgi:hypothetical protein